MTNAGGESGVLGAESAGLGLLLLVACAAEEQRTSAAQRQ